MDAALRAGFHIIDHTSYTFLRPGAERSALDLSLVTDECCIVIDVNYDLIVWTGPFAKRKDEDKRCCTT
ncbi:hypothetical protein MRX96_033002 [Rhipicephalus microplus]